MRLFIYCSDPREKADLETKICQKLLVPGEKIMRLANCGYPIVLSHPIAFPHEANTLLRQINFMIREFHPEQIVFPGHDCGWYEESVLTTGTILFEKKRDILRIHKMLLRRYPSQVFKSFFDVTQGEKVQFEPIAA